MVERVTELKVFRDILDDKKGFEMLLELPVLDYCSPIWMSAAASHLCLLDRVVSKAVRLRDGLVMCDLEYRRRFAALCMVYKIHCNPDQALEAALPQVHVLACVQLWNSLDEP